MASLARELVQRARRQPEEAREWPTLTLDQAMEQMQFGGLNYPFIMNATGPNADHEVGSDFTGFANQIYKQSGPVFALIAIRGAIFSEAKFKFRELRSGRPGNLFGTPALDVLNSPGGAGASTAGSLLGRMVLDVDLAGNWYGHRIPGGIERLRPDWMTILLGRKPGMAVDQVVGYAYERNGPGGGEEPMILLPEEVAHWAPKPDPLAWYRGVSWITPLLNEIEADQMAMDHKARFFRSGATPGLAVTLPEKVQQSSLERFKDAFDDRHRGMLNAYETLFLGGGADVKVVGADLKQLDFKVTQGHGETRIAAAAEVPPVLAGFSEGLDAATYSNYAQARRRFADGTIRPLWRTACDVLWRVIEMPPGAQLWYDDRDIPFLQEDRKDAAEIGQTKANTVEALVRAGFNPDAVIDAVQAEDFDRLKGQHSGLFSVQLQPPGSMSGDTSAPADSGGGAPDPAVAPANGNGAKALPSGE